MALSLSIDSFAQSAKIAGIVRSASTGEPLIGVNVLVDGTLQGAVTDIDGHYFFKGAEPLRQHSR